MTMIEKVVHVQGEDEDTTKAVHVSVLSDGSYIVDSVEGDPLIVLEGVAGCGQVFDQSVVFKLDPATNLRKKNVSFLKCLHPICTECTS